MPAVAPPLSPAPAPARRFWRDTFDVLGSMRFAIALLTLICIASIIGTVVKQNEPLNNYVNQFGAFWAPIFAQLGLYKVYGSAWFMLIMAFLVLSTSLCIARNTPKIITDLKTYKENLREQSLQAFHHKAQGTLKLDREAALVRLSAQLAGRGWRTRTQLRESGVMIAARKGQANKLGYLAAHSAIVLICLASLLDSDLMVHSLMRLRGVTAHSGAGLVSDVGAEHRLPASNPSFRGNMFVTEGRRSDVAVLTQADGVVLQELPFEIELKKFKVEFYDTGMPKLFASDIVIHDRDTGAARSATVKVNEPVFHRDVAIYQSSFEDGGSALKLSMRPFAGGPTVPLDGSVGGSNVIASGEDRKLSVEFSGLRVFNVENLAANEAAAVDVRKVDLVGALQSQLGSGVHSSRVKTLRNVGPSFSYKLRDPSGQAIEYNNYMLPVELDGQRVFLAGVRESTAENFRYLRIPADDKDSMDTWFGLRAALGSAALRTQAVDRYVERAMPDPKGELAEPLRLSARRALALYAGAEKAKPDSTMPGGLMAVSEFVEANVPVAERERAGEVLLRILNGCLLALTDLSREQAGKSPLPADERTQAFMTAAVLSLSDAMFYPAPVLLQLDSFEQVQASVFQLTRSPGKTLVYLGCALLIVGVFAMLYIRERRLWLWLQDDGDGSTRVTAALSTTRQTLDADREFETLQASLLGPAEPTATKEPTA